MERNPPSTPRPTGPLVIVASSSVLLSAAVAGIVLLVQSRNTPATFEVTATADETTPSPVVVAPVVPPPAPPLTALVTPGTARTSGAYERARQAVLEGRDSDARALLEPRVRGGRGTPDEARLLKAICKSMHDVACVDDIKRMYSGV